MTTLKDMAVLIVDALADAGFVGDLSESRFDHAVAVVEEELTCRVSLVALLGNLNTEGEPNE